MVILQVEQVDLERGRALIRLGRQVARVKEQIRRVLKVDQAVQILRDKRVVLVVEGADKFLAG